jgi:hypothetical protein
MSVSELNFSNRGLSPIPLDESSTSCFVLSLGNLILDSELIVAEIEDEALLGLDILMKGKGEPLISN